MYNVEEQNIQNSKVFVSGIIESSLEYNHEVYGEKFYKTYLNVMRKSGANDILPVIISERLIFNKKIEVLKGSYIEIFGEIRSKNKMVNGQGKLEVYIFALGTNIYEEEEHESSQDQNSVWLSGIICKEPIYRTTPFGREITDVMLAVNRKYGKSSYIPCIMWGRVAYYVSQLKVGDKIEIWGRFQSREYLKRYSQNSEEGEIKVAYEVSVYRLNMLSRELY